MGLYTIDILNSKIYFTVRYLEFSKVIGHFTSFSGTIKADLDSDIIESDIEVEIDVASINTNEPLRDQHLISADFFHADLYPKIYFKKTNIEKTGETHFKLYGDLQIKDLKREVVLQVEVIANESNKDKLSDAHFHCKSKISRTDFNLLYGSVLESSPLFIGKEIDIEVDVQIQTN